VKLLVNLQKLKISLLLLGMLHMLPVCADHLVGGEITYTCVGDNQYQITLKIYRDCFATGAGFDQNPTMTIFQGNTQFMNLSWTGFTVSTIPIVGTGPCFVDPPNLCAQVGTYERIVTLPPSPQGYTIVHQRCCRGGGIINLVNSVSQGNTYLIDIPPNDVDCNTSPVFNDLPPVAICLNEELSFDHSASEADGDELVYSLCQVFHGGTQLNPAPNPSTPPPYTPVAWGPTFGPEDPITSDVPFTIDPETGLLEGTPTQIGKYVIGICVSEYRNGELLCTVRRDFQINVVPCNPVLAAAIGLGPNNQEECTGLDFEFVNDSFNADEFLWDFGDDNGPQSISNEFAPQYTYSEPGFYEVTLIANPGEPCADTASIEIGAFPLLTIDIDNSGYVCDDGQLWFFESSGIFDPAETTLTWDFGENSEPEASNDQNPTGVFYSSAGTKQVVVEAEQYGCTVTAQSTVSVPSAITAAIAPQSDFCDGYTMSFNNQSTNATSYEWHFNDPGAPDAISTATNPSHTFTSPGEFEVMLVASKANTCSDTAYQVFDIGILVEADFAPPPATCFIGHSLNFTADGEYNPGTEILWEFGEEATPQTASNANPSGITYSSPGQYPVTLTFSEGDCSSSHTAYVRVYPEPIADFSASIREGCAPFQVVFYNHSVAGTAMSYQWNFGDGETSNGHSPMHTYEEPGVYTVSLNVYTNTGCVGQAEMIRTEYIVVNRIPSAGFAFSPTELDIYSPEVDIIDQSEGSEACYYIFPDSTVLDGCDLTYFFEEAGLHEVTQVVTNEYGCQATVMHAIRVNGHTFYVPNAFSPNEDGVNDIFKPVMRGVSAYEMQIINRAGEVIFTTNDPEVGWNGAAPRGNHYVEPEVFIYRARITDMRGINFDYQGRVTVVR